MLSGRAPASLVIEIAENAIDAYSRHVSETTADPSVARQMAVADILSLNELELDLEGAEPAECTSFPSVFTVEFRQYVFPRTTDEAPPAYSAHIVHLASTIEKAVAWCKRNTGYAPHKLQKHWDFAIRKRDVDIDLVGGGLMMVLDWNGEVTGWTV